LSTETQPTSGRAQRRQTLIAPRSASARAYLRNGVPAVYRETWGMAEIEAAHPRPATADDDFDAFDVQDANYIHEAESGVPFAMQFLKALEEVLDPIVTLLDCLPAHMDTKLAPLNVLDTMTDWLGLPFEEHLPGEDDGDGLSEQVRHDRLKQRQRRLVDNALQISRHRGTKRGLERLLELMFGEPDQVFKVIDGGYCALDSAPPADPNRPEPGTFVVQWTKPLDPHVAEAVDHLVKREKPVNARCRLDGPILPARQAPDKVRA
jgi:phage tail-like protein